ncbi:hypothetical protein V8D89_004250 [Ganoderma adspersum]
MSFCLASTFLMPTKTAYQAEIRADELSDKSDDEEYPDDEEEYPDDEKYPDDNEEEYSDEEEYLSRQEQDTETLAIEYNGRPIDQPTLVNNHVEDQNDEGGICDCSPEGHSKQEESQNVNDDHWVKDCEILAAFHMKFYQGYLLIFCSKHGEFLGHSSVMRHLNHMDHTDDWAKFLKWCKAKKTPGIRLTDDIYSFIKLHIEDHFLDYNKHLVKRDFTLSCHVPELEIIKVFKCPMPQCVYCHLCEDTVRKHMNRNHRVSRHYKAIIQFDVFFFGNLAQAVFGKGKKIRWTAIRPGWCQQSLTEAMEKRNLPQQPMSFPTSASIAAPRLPPSTKNVSLPDYFGRLGWETWIKQSPLELESLLGLVNPVHSSQSIDMDAYRDAEEKEIVEMHLHYVKDFLVTYIKDAMSWTTTSKPAFKEQPFEKNSTYPRYADTTARVLFLLLCTKNQPSVWACLKVPLKLSNAIDSLLDLWKEQLQTKVGFLLHTIFTTQVGMLPGAICPMVAAFSLLLFYSSKLAVKRRIVAGTQTPYIQHSMATMSLFTRFLFMMCSIAINAVRLATTGYITAPLPILSRDSYQYKTFIGVSMQGNNVATKKTMKEHDYRKCCHQTFLFLTPLKDALPKYRNTAFATVHGWWFRLMPDAHSPGSQVTAGWTKDRQTLLFKSPSIQCNIKWSLFKISQLALEKEATDILRSLMPEDGIFQDLMGLQLEQFWNQNVREEHRTLLDALQAGGSLHSKFQDVLSAYRRPNSTYSLWSGDVGKHAKAFTHFLDTHDKLMEKLACSIIGTSGVPPRAGSIAGYAYAPAPETTPVSPLPSDLTSARTSNIGLIQESIVCGWSKSKAGSRRSSHNIDLHALSPTMEKILLVFLAFPRQALIQAARDHCNISSSGPLLSGDVIDSMGSKVFCGKRGVWNTKRITDTWSVFSKKHFHAKLRVDDVRHIMTSFYQHHFPTLSRPHKEGSLGDSAVDLQGDHTGVVSRQYYSHTSGMAREFIFVDPEAFVKLSKLHHAALGVGSIDPMWTDDELKTPLIHSRTKWIAAQCCARSLKWSQAAEQHLQQMPFICDHNKTSIQEILDNPFIPIIMHELKPEYASQDVVKLLQEWTEHGHFAVCMDQEEAVGQYKVLH